MPTYRVLYAKPEYMRDTLMHPERVTRDNLTDTHVVVALQHAANPDSAFHNMQGEHMTPEMAERIGKAAGRTSMSVGDALFRTDGTILICASTGWITHEPVEPLYPPDDPASELLQFEAYYAGPEAGDTYAKTPNTVTFWNLGKSHRFTIALKATSPDDAYHQLQESNMSAQILMNFEKHTPRLTMQAGDVLLQAGGLIHVRTQDGWNTTRVEDAPMR